MDVPQAQVDDVELRPALAAGEAADPRLRRRFAEVFGAGADDAWAWLVDPRRRGPSGAPSPDARLRALRRPLYGRDPEGARQAYLAARDAVRAERSAALAALRVARGGAAASGIAHSHRLRLAVGAAAGALAIAGAAAALTAPAAPTSSDAAFHAAPVPRRIVPPLAVAVLPVPLTPEEERRIDALFVETVAQGESGGAEDDLGLRLLNDAEHTADTGGLPADGEGASRSGLVVGTGGLVRGTYSAPPLPVPRGTVLWTMVVVHAEVPTDWQATITRRSTSGRPAASIVLRAEAFDGRTQYAKVFADPAASIARVSVTVPHGVSYDVQVLEAQGS